MVPDFGTAHVPGVLCSVIGLDSDGIGAGGGKDRCSEGTGPAFRVSRRGVRAGDAEFTASDAASSPGVRKSGYFPERVVRHKQIDDLNCAGRVLIGIVPDQSGFVSDYDLLLGTVPP